MHQESRESMRLSAEIDEEKTTKERNMMGF
jgi:hypothetical protein